MKEDNYDEKYQKTGAVKTSWWRENILSERLLTNGKTPMKGNHMNYYIEVWYAEGDREPTEYGPFSSLKEAEDFGRDFYYYKILKKS